MIQGSPKRFGWAGRGSVLGSARSIGRGPAGPTGSRAGFRPGQVADPHQIVNGRHKREHPPDSALAPMSRLAQQRHGLDPAEDLLDALAFPLADRVARWRVVRSSMALRRCAVFCATCGVTPSRELSDAVAACRNFCRPQRDAWPQESGHPQRRLALGRSGGPRHPGVHHQPIPVLHQHMPLIA